MRQRMLRSAAAIAALYFINGVLTASLGPRLPEIADNLGIGLGTLGLALAGQVVGLVAMMPLAARLVHRYGARAVGGASAVLYAVAIAAVGFAQGAPIMFAALLLAGAANAPLDVAAPTLGKGLQDARAGRKTLSGLELFFVIGLLLGSAVGAAAAGHFTVEQHLVAVAVVCSGLGILAAWLLPATGHRVEMAPEGMIRTIRRRPAIRALALIALAGLWCEAVGLDWAALFSTEVLDAPASQQGIVGVAFLAGILVALVIGGPLADRVGSVPVVRWGGVLIAIGMTVVVVSPSVPVASVGFLLAGLGLANVHPLALGAAGNGPMPGAAFAAVNAISYVGLFAERPGIGLIADATSLQVAFATVVVVGVLLALSAHLVSDR
ncbi:MAG: MFS transporter [Solirubrobacterales bacterium]